MENCFQMMLFTLTAIVIVLIARLHQTDCLQKREKRVIVGWGWEKNIICDCECHVQQLMSLKNQEQQQNLLSPDSPLDEETYECNETISDISLEFNQQKRLRQCQCTCRCKFKTPQVSEVVEKKQKKRLKRKNNKMKLKNKQKEQQQRALCGLQKIIKDIYALKSNFEDGEEEIEECLKIDINRDKFYEFINSIIRDQVEVIRKEIADYLTILEKNNQANQRHIVKNLFYLIRIIKQASPEIEKIINLFVSTHFNPQIEEPPFQKNLDEMTFSFLIKNYLQKSESFVLLCEIIFEREEFTEQRQLFQIMMNAYSRFDPQESESDEQYSDSGYESDEWDEQSSKRTINFSLQEENESKSRKRRQRKRRIKQEHEQNYDSIIKRMESMNINDLQRVNCNVEETWIQDIIRKRELYTRVFNKPFNKQ